MRCLSFLSALVIAVVLFQVPGMATPQETTTVTGTVVTLAGSTLTVKVGDQNMLFTVDQATRVIGTGGSTAQRAAEAEGKAGPALGSLIKPGDGVQVHYAQKGGANYASVIRRGITVPKQAQAPKLAEAGRSVSGQVETVTGNGLTVIAEGKTYAFTIDPKTRVLGHGFGTMTREKQAAGEVTKLADFIAKRDLVLVDFVQKGTEMQAVEIHMLQKAIK
ncbi:MAG: hypothetical protein ACE148_05510 [Vicinamibacterales bacterium]